MSVGAVVAAALALWGLLIGLQPLKDNSFFTHLATGRLILADGSVPSVDPYTFTARGEPWVVQSWLASVLYAALERMGGLGAVRVLVGLLCVAVVLALWALARRADGLIAKLVVVASAVAVGAWAWGPRPLMFGLLLLALTLLIVERQLPPLLLLPVFWLWVNTHGSFPLGLLLIAVLAIGARLDREPTRLLWVALGWAGVGTLLGALSPVGPALLTFPFRALERSSTFSYVVEWRSPEFSEPSGRVFLLQMLLAGALLVRAPRWRVALPYLIFGAASLVAARNMAVASIVVVPGMALGARGLGSLRADRVVLRGRGPVVAAAAAAVLVASVVAAGALQEDDLDLGPYPVDAVAWMSANGLLEDGQHRVVPDVAGNYLELVMGTQANVSQDDRVDVLPPAVVEDGVTLLRNRPGALAVLERWEPDAVLWQRKDPLVPVLLADPRWRLAYSDEDWVVVLPAIS